MAPVSHQGRAGQGGGRRGALQSHHTQTNDELNSELEKKTRVFFDDTTRSEIRGVLFCFVFPPLGFRMCRVHCSQVLYVNALPLLSCKGTTVLSVKGLINRRSPFQTNAKKKNAHFPRAFFWSFFFLQ